MNQSPLKLMNILYFSRPFYRVESVIIQTKQNPETPGSVLKKDILMEVN